MPQRVFDGRIPWLNGRRKYIGSSDAAAIFGHGYAGESISTVWAEKCEVGGKSYSEADLMLMEEGRIGERFVVEMFRNRHPDLRVPEKNNPFAFYVSSDYPFLCASLDCEAYAGEEMMPVEAKVIRHNANEWEDDKCPVKYIIQTQHQMLVTGTKRACVAALVYGRYQERWIERDDEFLELAVQRYHEFWQCVIDRTPPKDDSPYAYTARRVETNFGTARRLGKRGSDALRRYFQLKQQANDLEQKLNAAKVEFAEFATGVEFVILDDQSVVKLGKRSIEKKKELPRGVQIVL